MKPEEFKDARIAMGLRVSEVAALVAVSPSRILSWESGKGFGPHPSACQIIKWAQRGDIDIGYLLSREEP